jgi:Domain of unknown function (DUF4136)
MRLLPSILSLFLFGCSPAISVYHDYDRAVNFSMYHTFDWKMDLVQESKQNPLYYNELTDKRIKMAVTEVLTRKGYQSVSTDPQFFIHYHIVVEDKSVSVLDPAGHNYNPYWLGTEINAYQYKEGTLIIDLMDAHATTLIWRGWAVAVLDDLRPENIERKLNKTIERIFKALPNAGKP